MIVSKSKIIVLISIFAILVFAIYVINIWTSSFPEFYTFQDRMYEYTTILYHFPIMLPAILGFYRYNKWGKKAIVFSGYVLYLVIIAICYFGVYWSSDPLEIGLVFSIFGIPYCILFAIYLIYILMKNK